MYVLSTAHNINLKVHILNVSILTTNEQLYTVPFLEKTWCYVIEPYNGKPKVKV